MKLEDLDDETMRRALSTYLELAWDEEAEAHWPTLPLSPGVRGDALLVAFRAESAPGGMRKYTLRLGNRRYPFMKLVFQELLRKDAFFFAVDSHDELDIRACFPDYDEWLAIKNWNAELKQRIERRWAEQGIATMAAVVAEEEAKAPAVPVEEPRAPLLLVVDDDAGFLSCATMVLRNEGYRLVTAHSGEEAIRLWEERRPQGVLSDLNMGGMNGLELAAAIREQKDGTTPFLLMSTNNISERDLGPASAFLRKPYLAEELLAAVESLLGREPGRGRRGEESAS